MAKKYQNFIDGQWCDSINRETFENRNPANWDEVVGIFPKSTKQEVDKAVSAARKVFDDWRLMDDSEKSWRFDDPAQGRNCPFNDQRNG